MNASNLFLIENAAFVDVPWLPTQVIFACNACQAELTSLKESLNKDFFTSVDNVAGKEYGMMVR